MKKIIVLLIIVLIGSCTNDEKENTALFLKLSNETLEYSWKGGAQEMNVETNSVWDIVSLLPSWLTVEKKSDICLSIAITENDTDIPRLCEIVFAISQQKDTLVIVQRAQERLSFKGEKNIFLDFEKTYFSVEIEKNIAFKIDYLEQGEKWISLSSQFEDTSSSIIKNPRSSALFDNTLYFNVDENQQLADRQCEIVVFNETCNLSDTLLVCQKGSRGQLFDGECVIIQCSSKDNANIVIMGDGFTKQNLSHNGHYEKTMRQTADYFFSIEPYKTYRDYFNVYMVVVESEEEGVGEKGSLKKVKNKFDTVFGSGTEITCNADLCFEYARKVIDLPANVPISVIIVLNSTKYAGTTYLYSDGNSIALCPMSEEESPNNFEGLIHHEAGGHGFGFLCDEYVYYDKMIPESRKENIKEWQKLGFQMNLDFTNNPSVILWKDFLGIEKYNKVGAYEGGYEYQYGVWRSEENSCMNNNIPYFNVQSRWNIVNRIMKLSGTEFNIHDFIERDNLVSPAEATTRSTKEHIPLGNPIWEKLH